MLIVPEMIGSIVGIYNGGLLPISCRYKLRVEKSAHVCLLRGQEEIFTACWFAPVFSAKDVHDVSFRCIRQKRLMLELTCERQRSSGRREDAVNKRLSSFMPVCNLFLPTQKLVMKWRL